jgi:isopenicillin-N N-acyltransferase-like protein
VTIKTIHAKGSPADIGLVYGAGAASEIGDAVAFYRRWAGDMGARWEALIGDSKPFIDAAREATPDGVEELEGIARGAGQSFDDLTVLNCIEETWPEQIDACTSAATSRFLFHAEQWTQGHDGVVVVIAEPADSVPFVSPSCAGFLPAVGLSAAGFALGVDSLVAADDGVGVPRAFVARAALGADSIDAALKAMEMPGRSGGYGFVLSAPGRSIVKETSATTSVSKEGEFVHTNHYLFSAPPGGGGTANSATRLKRARELMATSPPDIAETGKRFLSDHANAPDAICMHANRDTDDATLFGMICDTVSGEVLVSDGHPCGGVWEAVTVPGYRPAERRV